MQTMYALAVLLVLAGTSATEVTPVQKVIQLMEGMIAKGKSEMHKEEVQFTAYKQWCDDTTAAKEASITEAEGQIAILKADIAKATATAAELTKQIAAHDDDITVWKGDIVAATKVRGFDKVDYDALHLDYSESIDALDRAIAVLKKQDYDRKQAAASLIQVKNSDRHNLIPEKARKALDLFVSQDLSMFQAGEALAAPEANAYEFQSSGVIDMLEKLLDEFIEKRTELEKEEMNSKHAYEMLIAELESGIANAESDRAKASADKAHELQLKADAEGDLKETSDVLAADEKYLADVKATCAQKASDFDSRRALREEELEAIEKAIEIISSEAVTGNADTYLPSMLQAGKKKGTAFAMLRAFSSTEAQARGAVYMHKQATKLHSRLLSTVAAHMAEDPFAKVKKMIKDLIVRLMDEANNEATHKGWCDTELATNEETRNAKTSAVEKLSAEIDELTASIASLGEDIAELTKAVAELEASMAAATKLRDEEKEKNEETVKDSQEAQAAVSQALRVLKDFYSKAAEATAFVQKSKRQPAIFEGAYTGMQAENGGVVGMLQVIQSDFARLESETKAAEASAQKEYEEFMGDSKIDKSAKDADIAFKTTKKQDETSMLASKKVDLENTQEELDDALTYFDKLKPSCVDADVSYDDRVARREQEIASLQEALKILEGKELIGF